MVCVGRNQQTKKLSEEKKTFSSFCGFLGSVNSAQPILKSVWLSANKSTAKRTRKKSHIVYLRFGFCLCLHMSINLKMSKQQKKKKTKQTNKINENRIKHQFETNLFAKKKTKSGKYAKSFLIPCYFVCSDYGNGSSGIELHTTTQPHRQRRIERETHRHQRAAHRRRPCDKIIPFLCGRPSADFISHIVLVQLLPIL